MNILSIKLHRPAAPQISVRQQALIRRMNEGLEKGRPITLVSAPAGFGKTTCVCEWLAGVSLPVAWVSLEADDNEPVRFFLYLAAACRQLGDCLGEGSFSSLAEVEEILRAGQLPPPDVIAAALMNDLSEIQARSHRLLLVLDDFHQVQDRAILQVFEKLIAGLFHPNYPQPMHLVLLTREDPALPLARLRASDQMTEVRAEDLRLSTADAGRFLNDVLDLHLEEPDIQILEDRTEGWIAGLQLAGLSLRGRGDVSGFVRRLSGNHRFILGYLTEEVLNRQTEEVQQFLLDTSILDRMCGELCNAVTQRTDGAVVLDQLWNANLFLIPLDDEFHWYRYHHLFGELLRSRQAALQSENTAELHRRASAWYAQASVESERVKGAFSERVALVSKAIEHAIAASDYATVVCLIENYAMEITSQWYVKVVEGWMQSLPDAWASQSPRANLIYARHYLMHNNLAQASPYLSRLQAIFASPTDENINPVITPSLRAGWLALRSTILNAQGKPKEALALAQEALETVSDQDLDTYSQIYLALASSYQQLGSADRAMDAYQKLIHLGRESGDMITELLGISTLTLMLIEHGKLHHGFALGLQGVELVEQSGELPPISGGIYGELGQICIHWNQLEQAERYFRRAAQVMELVGFSDIEIFRSVVKSRLALVRGDIQKANQEIQDAVSLMRSDAPAVVREEVIAQQVQVLLAQGDVNTAAYVLTGELQPGQVTVSIPEFEPEQNIPYPVCVLYNSALRILLARGRGIKGPAGASTSNPALLEQGLKMANTLLAVYRQRNYVPHIIETLLLRARVHLAMGSEANCLEDFTATIELAEPEGYISPFLVEGIPAARALETLLAQTSPGSPRARFIQTVLEAFPPETGAILQGLSGPGALSEPASADQLPPLMEALTGREIEVLRLMARGSTYEEIASALVVSINTIRTHIKAIYGKLGVNNRTSAMAAARLHRIL